MVGVGINVQVLKYFVVKFVFWQHAGDGVDDNPVGVGLLHTVVRSDYHTSGITGMPMI